MKHLKGSIFIIIGFVVGYGVSALQKTPTSPVALLSDSTLSIKHEQTQQKSPLATKNITDVELSQNYKTENHQGSAHLTEDEFVGKVDNRTVNNSAKYQKLEKKYLKVQEKIIQLELKLNELEVSEVSDQQLSALFPEKFDELVTGYTGEIRDDIYNFHQEKDLQDSGYSNSQHISDFITTHLNSIYVELDAVMCKFDQCEIRVIEKQQHSWAGIMKDMRQQPWWDFSNSNARSTSDREGNLYVYVFLK